MITDAPKSVDDLIDEAVSRDERGLFCPHCRCRDLRVVKSVPIKGGYQIRTRQCRHCRTKVQCSERILSVVTPRRT